MISQVKKKDFLPQNDQIWPKIGIFGQFGPGHAGFFGPLLVGRLVVGARGLYLARHLFTLWYLTESRAFCVDRQNLQSLTSPYMFFPISANFQSEVEVMGRQDSYEDMDEPLLMRGQEYQVIMVGFPEVGLLAEPCL